MNNEKHTREAWLSLGHVVIIGAKGEFLKVPNVKGRGFHYDHLFSFKETIDASSQEIDCPSSRNNRRAAKEYRDYQNRLKATYPSNNKPFGGVCATPCEPRAEDDDSIGAQLETALIAAIVHQRIKS